MPQQSPFSKHATSSSFAAGPTRFKFGCCNCCQMLVCLRQLTAARSALSLGRRRHHNCRPLLSVGVTVWSGMGHSRCNALRSSQPLGQIRRTVLTGIPFCIAGVVLVARPPFLFGGAGIPTLGVAVALAQCTFSAAVKLLVRELRTTEQTNVGAPPQPLPVLADEQAAFSGCLQLARPHERSGASGCREGLRLQVAVFRREPRRQHHHACHFIVSARST